MNFDDSWDALLQPGKATVYFDNLDPKQFDPSAKDYKEINAWALAELCRLIYKQESDEIGKAFNGPTRQEVLQAVGFEEVRFFNVAKRGLGDTQCAIIRTQDGAASPFAALVFRGTTNLMDWVTNLQAFPSSWNPGGRVHEGFKEALELVWDEVSAELDTLKAKNYRVFYAGHSLGAALATLAASLRPPYALYTFGSPLVGDEKFATTLTGQQVYRVVNNRDKVTTLPPPSPFHHFGELHYITHDSKMLVNPDDNTVALDRMEGDHWSLLSREWHKHFTDAPEYLADHAPVNYVAHLERLA
jgi:triacylglycerol lipase